MKHMPKNFTLEADEEFKGMHVLHDTRYLMADHPEHEEKIVVAKFTDGTIAEREFIVTACNSHVELVSALKAFIKQTTKLSGFPELTTPYSAAIALANSALKSAGVSL